MKPATKARLERLVRPFVVKVLPPKTTVGLYSRGRVKFLSEFEDRTSYPKDYQPPMELRRELWGIKFWSPIMNAAGMFKNGECSALMALQGAGGYLAGTTTSYPRVGNKKDGIELPFVPYPRSCAASNWLGLPNKSSYIVASNLRLIRLCGLVRLNPMGVSVMGDPGIDEDERLANLVTGMKLYYSASVDFIEINESCPNTQHASSSNCKDLRSRLSYVKEHFLDQRERRLPVVVKFSCDTKLEQVIELMDLLFELGFDGVNFGNTSINYKVYRERIHPSERRVFDYFTNTFGGGISGRPLKESSLELCAKAVEHLRAGAPSQEFHVVRTGGIESAVDIKDSDRVGVSLNQWFTGYWEMFAKHGGDVYRRLYEDYLST